MSIVVSLVARLRVASAAHASDLRERARKRVVLVGRADGDAQAVVEPRPPRAVADEHAAVEQALPDLSPGIVVAAGTARSWRRSGTTSIGHRGERLADAARARRRSSFTRSSISSTKRSASRPAICLAASRWYGSTTLSSSATSHAGPTR